MFEALVTPDCGCLHISVTYPANLDRFVYLVVDQEVELFEHHVPLHGQVRQLGGHVKLGCGYGRLGTTE